MTAMITTYDAPDIRCIRAGIRSGSYTAATSVEATNRDCLAGSNSTLPDTVRSILGLPHR